jgi:hypothetical protein
MPGLRRTRPGAFDSPSAPIAAAVENRKSPLLILKISINKVDQFYSILPILLHCGKMDFAIFSQKIDFWRFL